MKQGIRIVTERGNRLRIGAMGSTHPDRALIDAVEGPARREPGRALDLGCGTGRNSVYLARHGWDVTGVDMTGVALDIARRQADAAGVSVRFAQGDVTRLADLGVGEGYTLLMDAGCLHTIPEERRDGYVESVTRAAAPGALLLMVGFRRSRLLGRGVDANELLQRFSAWQLTDASPIPGEEMHQYVAGPRLVKAALAKGWITAWRYYLTRTDRPA